LRSSGNWVSMAPRRTLSPKPLFDRALLLQAFETAGVKEMHAVKLWGHALRDPDEDVRNVPDLPKAAAALLDPATPTFVRLSSTVDHAETSADGLTTKLKVRLQDGLAVETVIMRSDAGAESVVSNSGSGGEGDWARGRNPSNRSTVCVSSQVGCQMGCTFCATGTMGLIGNLSSGEIVEQLLHALRHTPRIRNVVFMGMGEPMNNWPAVVDAVKMMTDSRTFGLSARHVTVSTVGVVPRIRSMHQELPGVSLALSLHAPNQALRQQIVPSAKAYPLPRLMSAVAEYQAASGRKVFVEYVVLAGVNDGLEQAAELGRLLRGLDVTLNLIPWNPVYSPASSAMSFQAPSERSLEAFQACTRGEYGVFTTVRQEKGQDISGACGQLVLQAGGVAGKAQQAGASGSVASVLRDIEELAV